MIVKYCLIKTIKNVFLKQDYINCILNVSMSIYK